MPGISGHLRDTTPPGAHGSDGSQAVPGGGPPCSQSHPSPSLVHVIGIERTAMPPDRFRVLCMKRAEHRLRKPHEAARHAHILGREAPGAVDQGGDFRPCLALPNLLDDHVVHPVIPKIVEMPNSFRATAPAPKQEGSKRIEAPVTCDFHPWRVILGSRLLDCASPTPHPWFRTDVDFECLDDWIPHSRRPLTGSTRAPMAIEIRSHFWKNVGAGVTLCGSRRQPGHRRLKPEARLSTHPLASLQPTDKEVCSCRTDMTLNTTCIRRMVCPFIATTSPRSF